MYYPKPLARPHKSTSLISLLTIAAFGTLIVLRTPQISLPNSRPNEATFPGKVKAVAARINADPVDLLTLMSFETGGTLNPKEKGPYVPGRGRATGLIQFMPDVAREMGTSSAGLERMSALEQMDYVERYFKQRGYKGGGIGKLYATVFAGNPNASLRVSDGYHTLETAVARMQREHRPRAIQILNGSVKSPI